MKHLLGLMLSALTLFGLDTDGEKYQKVPLTVPVDFSKKGTVYETDFQAPWNIWGSLVSFGLRASYEINSKLTQEQEKIYDSIRTGYRGNFLIPKEENQYFKLKITLTPLGRSSEDVTIWTGVGSFSEMVKKEFTKGQIIEEIVYIPLYGYGTRKMLIIADLQRLRNYHIRVESLEDVELPKGVSTGLFINRYSRKV